MGFGKRNLDIIVDRIFKDSTRLTYFNSYRESLTRVRDASLIARKMCLSSTAEPYVPKIWKFSHFVPRGPKISLKEKVNTPINLELWSDTLRFVDKKYSNKELTRREDKTRLPYLKLSMTRSMTWQVAVVCRKQKFF